MTSASDVAWFSREIQDLITAGAGFNRRPNGLKEMRVKIILKNQILFISLKNILEFSQAFFCCSESFDGTRLGRKRFSYFISGHSSPSRKWNLRDALNLYSNTIVRQVLFECSDLLYPWDRTSFSTESRDRPFFRQGLAHKNFCFKSNCFTKVGRCNSKNL